MTKAWNDLSSKHQKNCELCYTSLRVFQNKDWTNRKYHKKCFLNREKGKCVLCEKSLRYKTKHSSCDDCIDDIFLRKGYEYCETCDGFISPKNILKYGTRCYECRHEEEEECLISD